MAPLIAGGLLIVFSLWWMYFARDHASIVENPRAVWVFGYGHLPVFASIAAVGAALAAAVDVVEGEAAAGTRPIALALAVAVSVVALTLSGLHAMSDRDTVATMRPGGGRHGAAASPWPCSCRRWGSRCCSSASSSPSWWPAGGLGGGPGDHDGEEQS